MTVEYLAFPRTDEPVGEWAEKVLRSGWDFNGISTRHNPEAVRAFLMRMAEENPRRRSDDLNDKDWLRFERVVTDFKSAVMRSRHEERRAATTGLWDD